MRDGWITYMRQRTGGKDKRENRERKLKIKSSSCNSFEWSSPNQASNELAQIGWDIEWKEVKKNIRNLTRVGWHWVEMGSDRASPLIATTSLHSKKYILGKHFLLAAFPTFMVTELSFYTMNFILVDESENEKLTGYLEIQMAQSSECDCLISLAHTFQFSRAWNHE